MEQITPSLFAEDGTVTQVASELSGVYIPEKTPTEDAGVESKTEQVHKVPEKVNATKEIYDALQRAYDFYNERLFDGKLPGALIVMSRKKTSRGHFSPGRYINKAGQPADEISLNPEFFAVRSVEEVLSTLAHEACHQAQWIWGHEVRSGYHNKEFSDMMYEIGLITSSTGFPGGDRVGERMSHYIAENGKFIMATRELLESDFGLLWYDRYPNLTLMRAPSIDDIKHAEDQRKEVEAEVERLKNESGKGKSNRGRKKTPVLNIQPAAVSTPAIIVEKQLSAAIGADIVHVDPVEVLSNPDMHTKVAARLVKRQVARAKSGKRVKYTCPSCHDSAWGKSDMVLICGREGCGHAKFVDAKELSNSEMDTEDDVDLVDADDSLDKS